MKWSLALALVFIHSFSLTSLAVVASESMALNPLLSGGLALLSFGISFVPLVRTLLMFLLLLAMVPFWKAFLVTLIAAAILLMLEGAGEMYFKRSPQNPRP